MSRIVDHTNKRFGRLVALSRGPKKDNRPTSYWMCACDCGNVVNIRMDHLSSGKIQSCGCIRKEHIGSVNVSHGMSGCSEYGIWENIKKRCYNPKNIGYHRYGGKGIVMCDEWRDSFEAFYRDMGPRPSSAHSVDRRNGKEGYAKNNCHWATHIEQANNTSTNIFFTLDGERKTLAMWCREFDVNYKTVHWLLTRKGMQFEDALDLMIKRKNA